MTIRERSKLGASNERLSDSSCYQPSMEEGNVESRNHFNEIHNSWRQATICFDLVAWCDGAVAVVVIHACGCSRAIHRKADCREEDQTASGRATVLAD